VRYANGDDLISVDPATGNFMQIATGFSNPLALLKDPNGQILLGTHGGGGIIYRIGVVDRSGISGDFNDDGMVNSSDWLILKNHFNQVFSGTVLQAYSMGDINIDLRVNYLDFGLFKSAYEDVNGSGSFAELGAAVPEPTTLATSVALLVISLTISQRRIRPR
jgi:hypothetical protein